MKTSAKDARERLFLVAKEQAGIFTARQAEEAGFHSSHHSYHVRVGNWSREFKGIFRLPHFPVSDQSTLILWQLWSKGRKNEASGVYSHQTALKLHGLLDATPGKLYMTVPKKFRRNTAIPSLLILRSGEISKGEVEQKEGIGLTTPLRTLLDVIREHEIPDEELSRIFLKAKERGLVTESEMERHGREMAVFLDRTRTLREEKPPRPASGRPGPELARHPEQLGRFLHSRGEQLANYLRDCLQRGELIEPLPGMRSWSRQLGVSRENLSSALRVLKKEGLLEIGTHGVRLNSFKLQAQRRISRQGTRIVRFIYHGLPTVHEDLEWIEALSESLHRHGIHLILEHCDTKRLRALAQRPKSPVEMYILNSVPEAYHKLLFQQGCSLLLGMPLASRLPSITSDQESAVRHATQFLLRRGFVYLDFLNIQYLSAGRLSSVFESTCKLWPHQPIKSQSLYLPKDIASLRTVVSRYVQRIKENRGILIYAPLPLALIQTALLQQGFEMPAQVQLVSLFHSSASIQVQPAPVHYALSISRLLRTIKGVILEYFETGNISPIHKILPVEVDRPL